jgi:hypothetical protein
MRQWLQHDTDGFENKLNGLKLDIPSEGFRQPIEEDDDVSSQHKGAPRTPQTEAREAALEAVRQATLQPADSAQRISSARKQHGGSHPPRPSLLLDDGMLFGEEIAVPVSLLRKDGTMMGLYASAAEAVDAATEGCTVCLPAGIFEGSLVIRHPIRIVSSDNPSSPHKCSPTLRDSAGVLMIGSTLVSRTSEPVVTVRSKGVTLTGIAIQQVMDPPSTPTQHGRGGGAGAEEEEEEEAEKSEGGGRREGQVKRDSGAEECAALLVIEGGHVTLEHCLVRNARGPCVCVSGKGSMVAAKMSKFVDGAAGGILFENGGGGVVSECDLSSNRKFGVLATGGSDPVISSTLIHDGSAEGLVFFEANGLVSLSLSPARSSPPT